MFSDTFSNCLQRATDATDGALDDGFWYVSKLNYDSQYILTISYIFCSFFWLPSFRWILDCGWNHLNIIVFLCRIFPNAKINYENQWKRWFLGFQQVACRKGPKTLENVTFSGSSEMSTDDTDGALDDGVCTLFRNKQRFPIYFNDFL